MTLYTDTGNNISLKILLASKITGFNVKLSVKTPDENVVPFLQKTSFPTLEYGENLYIFSANEACRYILRKSKSDLSDILVDQYLEVESSTLQPLLHNVLCGMFRNGEINKKVSDALAKCLQTLNSDIGSNGNFVGGKMSAADLVLWSTLFPVLSSVSPDAAYKTKYSNLAKWFDNLQGLPEFQQAVRDLTKKNLGDELKNSLLSRPAPLLPIEFTNILSITGERGPSSKTTSDKSSSSQKQQSSSNSNTGSVEAEAPSRPPVTKEEAAAAVKSWNKSMESRPTARVRNHPIVPKEGEKNILITSALPYVNNVPHLGNIIGCVLSADVYSRFCQLRNYNSLYICGTDEYGTATETKAVEEGLTPKQICDKYNKLHTEIYQWFNIGFDYFGRTTTKQQTEIAQDIFWKLNERGYILKDSVEQLQCVNCNRFLADRFVEGTCPVCLYEDARGDQCDKCGRLINAIELIKPRCKVCSQSPIVKSSEHLFMDLPGLEPLLQKHLDQAYQKGIWTSNTKQITNSWIRDGLKPRCITRDLKWGTPVPMEGYTDKVFYVWYDAPIGYISITANYCEQWQKWWKNPQQVELYNFMAKDNVPFHSVIFPSSLLGTDDNWTVVNHLSATEYLNYEEGKFSKSRGVGVFGNDAQDTGIPADIWRFYLLFVRPETQDSAFSWDDFMTKNNSELLNNLGNFINRALMFVSNQFKGTIPSIQPGPEDIELLALVKRELVAYIESLEKIRLRDGIRNILSISRLGNQYIQAKKPWVKVKGSDDDKIEAGTVVSISANIACLLSIMVQPYMPEVSKTIQAQLNAPTEFNVLTEDVVCLLKPGHKIGQPSPLFQKLEQCFMDELKARFAGKQDSRGKPEDKKSDSKGKATEQVTSDVKPKASPEEIERLTAEVTKQGEKVRELKASNAEKAVIDIEITTLLSLKKSLAEASGVDPNAASAGKKKGKGKKK